ncbi:MAG: nucleotidyltransferase family protein [Pseudomonadota bacterium]
MMICGLILAAGVSSRMGACKALLSLRDGSTLLSAQYNLLKNAGCESIAVVVGANNKDIVKAHEDLDVIWVENEQWELGQFSSLQCGLDKLLKLSPPPHPSPLKGEGLNVVILPIDTVGVEGKTVEILISEAQQDENYDAYVPEYAGRGGHPILITKKIITRSLDLDPKNERARLDFIISEAHHRMVPVDDKGIRNNINTRSQWRNYISQSQEIFQIIR